MVSMTTPSEFWDAINKGIFHQADETNRQVLSATASTWRTEGNHFAAGYAAERLMISAWGYPEQMYAHYIDAVQDFENCVNSQQPDSLSSLAALLKLNSLLEEASLMFGLNTRIQRESVFEELGQRLTSYFSESSNKVGYLVTGIYIKTDLASDWEPTFPDYEVMMGEERSGSGFLTLNLPSAFQIFVALGDYQGAQTVVNLCSEGFTTPGLRGWHAAVRGFTTPSEAVEAFAEAAAAFAEDSGPNRDDLTKSRQSWSSINIDLWAKFFRSRSALALAVREPKRVRDLIAEAANYLQGTNSGWHDTNVSKYGILVKYLAYLIVQESGLTSEEAQRQYLHEARLSGEREYDPVAMRFLSLSAESFEGFRVDPVKEITSGKLPLALEALSQIPLIGPDVTKAVSHELGEQAVKEVLGPNQSWIYRTLESIQDEGQLQKITLRLLQEQLPLYAQIIHGPLEYGKDVVVGLEEDDQRVLRMYQLKCGNISTPVWRTTSKQLEEMFLVPLSDLQFPEPVDVRAGILLANGHATPHVVPIMDGWFKEQRDTHGRNVKFMQLDEFVQWIMEDRLINAFRAALNELDLEIIN